MIHTFLVELTDEVKGYEDSVDYFERVYGAEEFDLAEHDKQVRAEVIEEVFGKIEERLNDSTTVTFDLPVEDVLGEDVDMDDFIMLAEEIVQEYKNLIFSKLKQAKKQLKEQKE